MRIKKAKLSPKILKTINLYRDKEPSEIRKIEVLWACGVNKKYSRYSRGGRVFYVELKKLIDSADFGEMMFVPLNPQQLFTGIDERDFRVAQILDHWSKGGYIDPPDICLNHLGQVSFGDGRHRTVAAFHLGEKRIPVTLDFSLIKEMTSLLDLKELKEKPRRSSI